MSTEKRKVLHEKRDGPVPQVGVINFYPDRPRLPSRGGGVRRAKIKIPRNTPRTTQSQPTTPQTCPVRQMSGPIAQTSPDAERGGVYRQDKIRGNHPQPSPRKTNQEPTYRAENSRSDAPYIYTYKRGKRLICNPFRTALPGLLGIRLRKLLGITAVQ